MNNPSKLHRRVLAIYLNSRGFGFVVLEGRELLIDWGIVQVREEKYERCLGRISQLINRYQPRVVLTEDPVRSTHRGQRIRELLVGIRTMARTMRVRWRGFSRIQVRRTFRSSVPITKQQIAEGLAGRFPELTSRLPPPRKPWMSEDARMAIFEALAVALTYYSSP